MDNTFNEYDSTYAIVSCYGDRSYGHMRMRFYNFFEYSREQLELTCQAGGGGRCDEVYAISLGIAAQFGAVPLHFIATHGKKLNSLYSRYNSALECPDNHLLAATASRSFTSHCCQLAVASKIDKVFIAEEWGGGYHDIKGLTSFNPRRNTELLQMNVAIQSMEDRLIDKYRSR